MAGYVDFHVHSTLSGDGKSTIEEHIVRAAQVGVQTLCLTEHVDLDVLDNRLVVDTAKYHKAFLAAQDAAKKAKVELLMGLEIGYTAETAARAKTMADALPLDFRLLSRHIVGGKDPYEADYFAGKTRQSALEEYLEAVFRSIRYYDDYDAVAHIGYVFKFSGERFSPMRYADAPDHIDAILRSLIEKGKALELNTSRLPAFGMPGLDVFARYKELGGELVTLGSDAHHANDLAKGFDMALEGLRALGFTHLCTYKRKKLHMVNI